eukprot:gene20790-26950_t
MYVINIAGFATCGPFNQAKRAILGLEAIMPDRVKGIIHECKDTINAPNHKTSPIVWFEDNTYLGGRDDTIAWCKRFISAPVEVITPIPTLVNVDPYVQNHGFQYDLIVIGGGSGGLACAKEAKRFGAKVAVLDYVKPSPQGSKWGLGGTCVNVGCIPKKLMHQAALLGDAIHDSESYGWDINLSNHSEITTSESSPTSYDNGMEMDISEDTLPTNKNVKLPQHSWEKLRESVQDHIKGLNFGYRVQLREKGIVYLNKLGKFVSPHELQVTDAKGKSEIISGARIVIAVGGRPLGLEKCIGSEYAISSDDLFSLDKPPGKTCIIGAGYIALECAGFIQTLNHSTSYNSSVTLVIRSIALRGFDRDSVNVIMNAVEAIGVKTIYDTTPTHIEKQANGKLLVTLSNGFSEEFDTVLAAIGRKADTEGLGIDIPSINLPYHPTSKKLYVTNEQTAISHIYAIGDVCQGVPELTPVAILSGKLLAKRLFNNESTYMNYKQIATTVFSPIEYGFVGYNEEEAIDFYGKDVIDSYISTFQPLEWSITNKINLTNYNCYTKIVVKKEFNSVTNKDVELVIGLHIVSPNAGEIIQGFAVAIKQGITYEDLQNTVGIHPTIAEEFTVMTITKSSGLETKKTSC